LRKLISIKAKGKRMQFKKGISWKAAYNEEKGVYGAEVIFQGSWDLYEISAAVYHQLTKNMNDSQAEKLIQTGRRLYSHVNDRCGPPYTLVLDDDYADYCPWMADSKPVGRTWDEGLTDAAVEVLASESENREQRRRKREQRNQRDKGNDNHE